MQIVEVVQTVLTGIILAFIFRAFFIEGFVIPTGSMAEGLRGRHAVLRCDNCGWEFAYGPAYSTGDDRAFVAPEVVICPNCHAVHDSGPTGRLSRAGDRVLVDKWSYALGGPLSPRRWEVMVFRDPADPSQNYIKRVVALPGETVEIIDGDVYICETPEAEPRIIRKPPAVQAALWLPVFNQAYFPHRERDGSPAVRWRQAGDGASDWQGLEGRVLRWMPPTGSSGAPGAIDFDSGPNGLYGRDLYGYDSTDGTAYVGDVRLVAEVRFRAPDARIDLELTRDGAIWRAGLRADGSLELARRWVGEAEEPIGRTRITPGAVHAVSFEHLDQRVGLWIDGAPLLATEAYSVVPDKRRRYERVEPVTWRLIAGGGSLEVGALRLERDVHYTASFKAQRSVGAPFSLRANEYFVLGDNSPASHDSREWFRTGPHLRDSGYRPGTVRTDQIVGRAFFVYLPGLVPMDSGGRFWVPELGRVRWVR